VRCSSVLLAVVAFGITFSAPCSTQEGPPPDPLAGFAEYAGRYEHPGLGRITVAVEGGRLRAALNDRDEVALSRLRHDVWLSAHALRIELDSLVFRFLSDRRGDIDALDVVQEGGPEGLVFRRLPDEETEN
jgi:hypothetical protein